MLCRWRLIQLSASPAIQSVCFLVQASSKCPASSRHKMSVVRECPALVTEEWEQPTEMEKTMIFRQSKSISERRFWSWKSGTNCDAASITGDFGLWFEGRNVLPLTKVGSEGQRQQAREYWRYLFMVRRLALVALAFPAQSRKNLGAQSFLQHFNICFQSTTTTCCSVRRIQSLTLRNGNYPLSPSTLLQRDDTHTTAN